MTRLPLLRERDGAMCRQRIGSPFFFIPRPSQPAPARFLLKWMLCLPPRQTFIISSSCPLSTGGGGLKGLLTDHYPSALAPCGTQANARTHAPCSLQSPSANATIHNLSVISHCFAAATSPSSCTSCSFPFLSLSQGEGGLFHGDTFKQRFFVLARVPHATVLIYYSTVNLKDEMHMDEANIMGFIDLRKVQAVREVSKVVSVDGGGGIMSSMKKMFGGGAAPAGAAATPRSVIELVMAGRTYVLCPASIGIPAVILTSQVATMCKAKPLYLFGWPFPVPPLDLEAGVGSEVRASEPAVVGTGRGGG